jgi:hypothetical protein
VKKAHKSTYLKVATLLLFMLFAGWAHAQDMSEQQAQNLPTDTKAQRTAAKKAKERQKAQEKATKQALKDYMKMQTPEVRKRMKQHAKESNRENEHKEPGFFYKLFHHHKKSKATAKPGTQPN